MAAMINAWEVEAVQRMYAYLKLSAEQAAHVYQMQQHMQASQKHRFSMWEWWDFELATFSGLLDAAQLTQYVAELEKTKALNEAQLSEGDAFYVQQVQQLQERVNYYEEVLVPVFYKEPMLVSFYGLEQSKVNFLKAEYQQWLREHKQYLLVTHFREFKTFQPHRLKASLLRHRLYCLFPESALFIPEMDAATKAVADFLVEKFANMYQQKEASIQQKLAQLNVFLQEIGAVPSAGEALSGWHVESGEAETTARYQRLLNLVLLERNGYEV